MPCHVPPWPAMPQLGTRYVPPSRSLGINCHAHPVCCDLSRARALKVVTGNPDTKPWTSRVLQALSCITTHLHIVCCVDGQLGNVAPRPEHHLLWVGQHQQRLLVSSCTNTLQSRHKTLGLAVSCEGGVLVVQWQQQQARGTWGKGVRCDAVEMGWGWQTAGRQHARRW